MAKEVLVEAFNSLLESTVNSNLREFLRVMLTSFFYLSNSVSSLSASDAGMTPSQWNTTIFEYVSQISTDVILPIGGMVISAILCYELISMVISKNNMKDVDVSMIAVYLFKACISVLLLSKSFDITMACFDLGNSVVSSASDLAAENEISALEAWQELLPEYLEEIDCITLYFMAGAVGYLLLGAVVMRLFIMALLYVRMIEIYFYIAIAPIPFATLGNREWGNIGTNYIRSILALAFQAFFIVLAIGIYDSLVSSFLVTDQSDILKFMYEIVFYMLLLGLALLKVPSISKSIFNAH